MRSLLRSYPPRAVLLAALAAAPNDAAAQDRCDPPPADSGNAALVIRARVHADAIVFDSEPATRITLNGCEPGAGSRVTSTLPDTIVPGVRYTDVRIDAEYRVRLNLECRPTDTADARDLCAALLGDPSRPRGAFDADSTDASPSDRSD